MITVRINGKEYKLPEAWHEITLHKAREALVFIDENIPEYLSKQYDFLINQTSEPDLDYENEVKILPGFYGRIIEMLSDIPIEVIERINYLERTNFYKAYFEKYVIGLIYFPVDYEYKHITSFVFNGVEYLLPLNKVIIDQTRPMGEAEAIEFTESSDLLVYSKQMKGGNLAVAGNIISILCRPKGERYDEQVCLKRAADFDRLPMDTVWEVFFCILKQLSTLESIMTLSIKRGVLSQKRHLSIAG